jgi:homoserine kinase
MTMAAYGIGAFVRVPATVGNFAGAGVGAALALDAPMNVKAMPRLDGQVRIRYFGEGGDRVPRDNSNLTIKAMCSALASANGEFTGADLEVYSSIPVGVGLGASAAAVWAGLIAANMLFGLGLEEKRLFTLAHALEPRTENVYAAWFGSLAVLTETGTTYRTALVPEHFELNIIIPSPSAPARASREARRIGNGDSERLDRVRQAAAVAKFFAQGAGAALFNPQPSAPDGLAASVAGLDDALRLTRPGLLCTFVCGSGPAVGVLTQNGCSEAVDAVRDCFPNVPTRVLRLKTSGSGARDWNAPLTAPRNEARSADLRF